MRGRGNYVSGRVYTRDFSGKTEFGNRGSNRGGFSNRGGDGYQRSDNMGSIGGRSNRGGGIVVNGTPKPAAPRMSATS
ncbi:hypothetical protein Acr_15g0006900 [Actinidia rufa]|nr:hypothetical protein Acr_15g0006900 [Actinidia rufa]